MDQSTSTAATLAARSAAGGLHRPPSSGSLSSAAAAAALRSSTTTPEPVGSIQTKRMVRRGSQSSIGSGSVMGRGGLQRVNSNGSMTDRTFRSPSPGSSNGRGFADGARSPDPYAPPVPAIPKNIPNGHQRSSSMEPPQRVMSPNRAPSTRGVSADRAGSMVSTSTRKPPRLSDVAEELERSDSTRNTNFSRPRASQPNSPMGSPTTDKKFTHSAGAWHSEPLVEKPGPKQSARAAAMDQKIARIQAAAGQAGRNSSVRSASQPAHLTRANLEAASAAADDYETIMVFDAGSRTFVPQRRLKTVSREPASPVLPKAPALKPGQYDPNTRTIVPHPAPTTAQPVATQRRVPPALDTSLAPPPRNPARLSPTSSPTTARHSLQKHPSVVHERPDEEEDGSDYTDSGKVIQTTAGPAKAYATPTTKPRSSSLDVPRGAMNGSFRGRHISTSPSPHRARFSASPVIQATIHNPPSRELSPAKSAMKHSPAPSARAASPLAHFSNPKSPSSVTSDTPSVASNDDTIKKKKSVRVSFDSQPQVTNLASPSSPRTFDDIDDDDDLMKPRPALPSFGSVRKNRTSPDYAEKVTEMAPERTVSSDHALGGILLNANGDEMPKEEPVELVVPSIETQGDVSDSDYSVDEQGVPSAKTTVDEQADEQAGEQADEQSDSAVKPTADAGDAGVVSRDFASSKANHTKTDSDVPNITLLPPTPGVEQGSWSADDATPKARLSKEVVLPGGWNAVEKEEDAASDVTETQDVGTLQAINEFGDSDDDDAAFSDAAEEQSDMEGGFASLDAIAVSPIVTSTKTGKAPSPTSPSFQKTTTNAENQDTGDWSKATAYWSTLSRQQREQIEREHFSSDDEARPAPAVKKTKKKTAPKQNAATSATTGAVQKSTPSPPSAQPAKPAMKKSMRAQPEPTAVEKPTQMRSSMRAQPQSAAVEKPVQMRSSMRAGGGSGMASTLRDGSRQQSSDRSGSMSKKTMRPQSTSSQLSNNAASTAGVPSLPRQNSQSSVMSQPRNQARGSSQPAQAMSARLQKELRKADDSDSDSSFKKQRRSARTHSGFAMKSSMRDAPEPVERAPQRAVSPTSPRAKGRDSFSIRSLSPTGSLFGRKKMNRDPPARAASVDPGVRTLRGSQSQKSSLRTSAPAPAPAQAPVKSTASKFKSRFADSDDEDDDPAPSRGGHFSSRFADSDDEDDVFTPMKLAPVRGIPRRKGQNDGDSTDLSDEEEQPTTAKREKFNAPMVPDPSDIDKAMEAARKKLGIAESPAQNGGQGGVLAQGSLRDSTQGTRPVSIAKSVDTVDSTPKKRGFMGSILRRNRASTASVPGYKPPTSMPSSPKVSTSAAAASSADVTTPGSPASPGKLVRRGSYQPQAPRMRRGDSTYSNATAPPGLGESNVGDWPLPPVPQIPEGYAESERPNTTEGTGVRFAEGTQVYSARTGKKKKFSMLRKAFGLHD